MTAKFYKERSDLKISMIAAMAANRVIGKNGDIPWRGQLKGEQDIFKRYTIGKVVIMGRNTWYSIPKKFRPLPLRLNVVITSIPDYTDPSCVQLKSIDEALMFAECAQHYDGAVFIGGQRIYEEGLKFCNTIYLSKLEAIFPGDTFFPKLNENEWSVSKRIYFPADEKSCISYNFMSLHRLLI